MTSDSHTSDSHGAQAEESLSQDSAASAAQAAADHPKASSEGLSLLFIIGAFAFYFALQLWILPAMGVST